MAVHRYKASEATEAEVVDEKKTAKKSVAAKKTTKNPEKTKKERKKRRLFAPFRAMKDYFVGSWRELRQVRWPNKKQTWALTLAVMLFSLVLGGIIFLLDLGFTYLFKNVIL